jgi:hypothetical protein
MTSDLMRLEASVFGAIVDVAIKSHCFVPSDCRCQYKRLNCDDGIFNTFTTFSILSKQRTHIRYILSPGFASYPSIN